METTEAVLEGFGELIKFSKLFWADPDTLSLLTIVEDAVGCSIQAMAEPVRGCFPDELLVEFIDLERIETQLTLSELCCVDSSVVPVFPVVFLTISEIPFPSVALYVSNRESGEFLVMGQGHLLACEGTEEDRASISIVQV